MLRKLMKHEFRATGRIMLPMLLLTLLTAVGANVSVRRLLEAGNGLAVILGALLLAAFVLAVIGVCVMSFVLMIRRFYQNLLRDEGYLMMTLPVSVHQQILSKALVSVVWFVVTAAVVALSILILIADVGLVRAIAQGFEQMLAALGESGWALSEHARAMLAVVLLWAPLLMVLGVLYMCLQCYAAMAIGHSFSAHKGVLSVAAYSGIQVVQGVLSSGAGWLLARTGLAAGIAQLLESMRYGWSVHLAMLGMFALNALLAVLMHAITAHFLTRRLNLE